MKNIFYVLCVILVGCSFYACGGGNGGGPSMEEACRSCKDADFKKLCETAYKACNDAPSIKETCRKSIQESYTLQCK